jgi:hypothetical protein
MAKDQENRIQITSDFTTSSTHAYKRVEDHKDGSLTVHETTGPAHSHTVTTVTTNPYELKTNSTSLSVQDKKSDKDFGQVAKKEKKKAYDTTQL